MWSRLGERRCDEHWAPSLCFHVATSQRSGVMKASPCNYFPKETCFERSTANASKENKFNIIIPFLSTAKQTWAGPLLTDWCEVEIRCIFRCIQLHDSRGRGDVLVYSMLSPSQTLLCPSVLEICMLGREWL